MPQILNIFGASPLSLNRTTIQSLACAGGRPFSEAHAKRFPLPKENRSPLCSHTP